MAQIIETTARDFEDRFQSVFKATREADLDVDATVSAILDDVLARGDDALIEYTRRFDRMTLTPERLRIEDKLIEDAYSKANPEDIQALEVAAERISSYHGRQRPSDDIFTDEAGVRLGHRWTPIGSVGLYVPGGTASYPSSVLMNALPARVAGVERLVMVVPTPDDQINPLVLVAASLAGVSEIYRVGGAQAIGALAYGTSTIGAVDKIVGPGNAYVAAAKRQVFGTVGIDMIAGPSEILVVSDNQNNPAWIAADLLSQAEHDPSAQSVLITDDSSFAQSVSGEIESALLSLPRGTTARESWERHGVVIIVKDFDEAAMLIDRIAPEHLELAIDEPDVMLSRIKNAGAIFLGRYTPEAIGDYVAGPNHVLPTARSARFSSGLSVLDFMKRSSIISCDEDSFSKIAPYGAQLARAEGLDAHALSISLRLKNRR